MKKISLIIGIILVVIILINIEKVIVFFNNSDVLGRRWYALGDNFEDPNWDYPRLISSDGYYISSNRFWQGPDGEIGSHLSNRGDPAIIRRIATPKDGKRGSKGALEIGTNIPDNDNVATQDDFLTIAHEKRLGRKLIRAYQPVFVVYVCLPPFDQWGEYYSFAFRQASFLENGSTYTNYSSIWLTYDKQNGSKPFFKYRIGTEKLFYEIHDPRPIEQAGWWTIAVAFDENGFDHYYARPGVGALTEGDRMFDATKLFYEIEDLRPVEQAGWKTLVSALDENSNHRYYCKYSGVRAVDQVSSETELLLLEVDEEGNENYYRKPPGVSFPAEIDKLFDMTHLIRDNLLIKYMNQSFFSLAYHPGKSNTKLRFVIDDYEVRVKKYLSRKKPPKN